MKLEYGFLLMYDWLPIFELFEGEDLKRLLFALIARQREGKPLPDFGNVYLNVVAAMIEPTIRRRLEGKKSSDKKK